MVVASSAAVSVTVCSSSLPLCIAMAASFSGAAMATVVAMAAAFSGAAMATVCAAVVLVLGCKLFSFFSMGAHKNLTRFTFVTSSFVAGRSGVPARVLEGRRLSKSSSCHCG
jgi:hypothetical protein